MIVADTNLISYLLIPGERNLEAENVYQKDDNWVVPMLWRSEFRNILTTYMGVTKMNVQQAIATMGKAEQMLADREYIVTSISVLELTQKTKFSAYDAEFVVLAKNLGVKLVTMDKNILKAVPKVAVTPREFVK